MKINSGTVGMESARSYRARGSSVRYERIREYRQNENEAGGMFGNAMSGSLTSNGWQEGMYQTERAYAVSGRQVEERSDEEGMRIGERGEGYLTGVGLRRGYKVRSSISAAERQNKTVAEDLRQITIRYIFELLFATRRGMRNRWLEEHGMPQESAQAVTDGEGGARLSFVDGGKESRSVGGKESQRLGGNGVQLYHLVQESTYAEEEHTSFAAKGLVKTADGREIEFRIDLSMSRSFEMTFGREIQKVKQVMKDPLVINFDAPAASVRDQKFLFDLDEDGSQEEISRLESGSGFLAIDLNEDGRIGDGSELFGTRSGDGFRELAKYDQDENGWIDENDAVWQKLKIWAQDENGKDVLYRLADKNIGAIYLGNVDTEYALLGQSGNTNGMIRRTGVFLYENGLAGTLQHLDLATYQREA